jgi:outer membrane protein TolC
VIAARRQHANLLADRVQARIALLLALGGRFDSVAAGSPTAANTEVSPP